MKEWAELFDNRGREKSALGKKLGGEGRVWVLLVDKKRGTG
jgi:hypothetical protein